MRPIEMNKRQPRNVRADGAPPPPPLRFLVYCNDPTHQPLALTVAADLRRALGDLALPHEPRDPDVLWKLDAPTGDFEFGLDCDDDLDDEPIEILLDAGVLDGERLEQALAATRAAMPCLLGTGGLVRIHAPGAVLRRLSALHADAMVSTARALGRAKRPPAPRATPDA
jgi:hypothetical protein